MQLGTSAGGKRPHLATTCILLRTACMYHGVLYRMWSCLLYIYWAAVLSDCPLHYNKQTTCTTLLPETRWIATIRLQQLETLTTHDSKNDDDTTKINEKSHFDTRTKCRWRFLERRGIFFKQDRWVQHSRDSTSMPGEDKKRTQLLSPNTTHVFKILSICCKTSLSAITNLVLTPRSFCCWPHNYV